MTKHILEIQRRKSEKLLTVRGTEQAEKLAKHLISLPMEQQTRIAVKYYDGLYPWQDFLAASDQLKVIEAKEAAEQEEAERLSKLPWMLQLR